MKWLLGGLAVVFVAVLFAVMVYQPSGDDSGTPLVVTDNSTKHDIYDPYSWARR